MYIFKCMYVCVYECVCCSGCCGLWCLYVRVYIYIQIYLCVYIRVCVLLVAYGGLSASHMFQCVAVWYSVLQCVAGCCSGFSASHFREISQ